MGPLGKEMCGGSNDVAYRYFNMKTLSNPTKVLYINACSDEMDRSVHLYQGVLTPYLQVFRFELMKAAEIQ